MDEFEAIQWSGDNLAELQDWDERVTAGADEKLCAVPAFPEPLQVPIGGWIVRSDEGICAMSDKDFKATFEACDAT